MFLFGDGAYFEYYRLDENMSAIKRDRNIWGYGAGFGIRGGSRDLILSIAWGESARLDEPRLNIVLSGQF